MYKLLLTFRYLRRKLIPLFALAAVTLCVAMLIIVISIMGGFHELLLTSGTRLMGDVKIRQGLEGFAHYDEFVEAIEALPEAEAAAPMIETLGLLKTPQGETRIVEVVGVDPKKLDGVTRFAETILWTKERTKEYGLNRYLDNADLYRAAMELRQPWTQYRGKPAIVTGLEINPRNYRMEDGSYMHPDPWLGLALSLTVLPITSEGGVLEPEVDQFVLVNEFHSGLFDVDSRRVYVPFGSLQKMLRMQEAEEVDPDDPLIVTGISPGKTSTITVRAAEGFTAAQLRDAISKMYSDFRTRYPDDLQVEPIMQIMTWQEMLQSLLNTVKTEKRLLVFMFTIISAVAILLVAVIFYNIVFEKTRDIGILRALGASRMGVASIFLLYGSVIGLVAAALGTGVAVAFVYHINEIHTWLGNGLGASAFAATVTAAGTLLGAVVGLIVGVKRRKPFEPRGGDVAMELLVGLLLGGLLFGPVGIVIATLIAARGYYGYRIMLWASGGAAVALAGSVAMLMLSSDLTNYLNGKLRIVIWDKRIYFFDSIPNKVDVTEVTIICIAAVIASMAGAMIPAAIASRMEPVQTLRHE